MLFDDFRFITLKRGPKKNIKTMTQKYKTNRSENLRNRAPVEAKPQVVKKHFFAKKHLKKYPKT